MQFLDEKISKFFWTWLLYLYVAGKWISVFFGSYESFNLLSFWVTHNKLGILFIFRAYFYHMLKGAFLFDHLNWTKSIKQSEYLQTKLTISTISSIHPIDWISIPRWNIRLPYRKKKSCQKVTIFFPSDNFL